MTSLEISLPTAGNQYGATRWQAELVDGAYRETLYFASTAFPRSEHRIPIRPFVLAALPIAMRRGSALRIPGRLDTGSYRNLMEWQQAMAAWHPGELQVVPLHAEVSPAAAPVPGEVATAFSGGVDSCYTALRYGADTEFRRRLERPLRAGIMIHGLDIPLGGEGEAQFAAAFDRSRRILASQGLEALSVATNARPLCESSAVDWSTVSHGALIASALACFEHRFAQMLIPSTYVYSQLRTPWASHPITDPLFSSSHVAYLHEGACANKLDKVDAIAASSAVRENLRVCWAGQRKDSNCGHCFKCVVTQACFWLNDVQAPAAFESRASVEELSGLSLDSEPNRYLFRYMRSAATQRGRPDIANALGRALRRPVNRWPKRYIRRKIKGALRGNRN